MRGIRAHLAAVAAVVAFLAADGANENDWENLAVNSRNRLPPRTYSMPLRSVEEALSDELEPPTPFVKTLNGTWKISWCGEPGQRPADFWRTDFDDSEWESVDVPCCLELHGFGMPGYTNNTFPHSPKWPRILDFDSGKPDYNPVASYRRTFTVPSDWKGRRIMLRFDGVYSAYYVWVNGRKVGYAEDSKLPSEFDITSFVQDGENQIAVEVYRWCDGSFLEDQDMLRFTGIFRDVSIWAMPKDGIWDFTVRTIPVDGYEKWKLEVKIGDESKSKPEVEQRMEVSLYDAEHKKVGDLHCSPSPSTFASTLAARAWSAEKPCLYTLVVRRGDDIRRKRVGFKEVRIEGHTLLFNGKPVKFHGVNRHEHSLENGRTVSLVEMIADVELMKRYNIDTVRTSHYPCHHLWYDLCDRYGIYLCAEANVEGHGARYGEGSLGRFPEWRHSIIERNERHVVSYRNHPCVAFWSLGNETGHGPCFDDAKAAVRALDPEKRPVHWERCNALADIDSCMYPKVSWLELRGRIGDGLDGRGWIEGNCNTNYANKAFFMCEYAHAMGNALGNFAEYWDVFYRYESLAGGCIWDWVDQAVRKQTDRIGADGRREWHYAYGGDWDEYPNSGPYCCNGVIRPDRQVTAKLVEVGHVHRPLSVSGDGKSLTLTNRHLFTWADEYDGRWDLVENGRVVRSGRLEVPHLAPLGTMRLLLPDLGAPKDGAERFLNVRFLLKEDCVWAKRGWTVAEDQIPLDGGWVVPVTGSADATAASVEVEESASEVKVFAGPTRAVFSRKTGTLANLAVDGTEILGDFDGGLVAGPRLTVNRAFVDNDKWLRKPDQTAPDAYRAWGLLQLQYHARPLKVERRGESVRVRSRVRVIGRKSGGFEHETVWTFAADGAVTMDESSVPFGTMPPALMRLGTSWILSPELENVAWYGRGPRENYVDRKSGSFIGVYTNTVTGLEEPYVRPQDNGYRSDVRWFALYDRRGKGVRFLFPEPQFVQALHRSRDDLNDARHWRDEPRKCAIRPPRKEVFLNLDRRQLGLGGGSCGPGPLEKYVFPIGPEKWRVHMVPFDRRKDVP